MAEAIAIPPFPEAPRKAQFPLCLKEHESFSCITARVSQVIKALPSSQQKQLSAFIQSALYPGVPEGKAPATPSSPKKLVEHVQQYCDPLNIGSLKILCKHLKDADLTRQLEVCECTLSDQLEQATWDTQVDVAPPPAYKIMLIKIKQLGSTTVTVTEAVKVRDFLAEHLMFKGQHGILCLAGFANNSLVFYIAEGNIGPMLQRMQHDKNKMLAKGVEQVTFVKLAKLDVASGDVTPHPDVPKINPAAECPEFSVLLIGETGSGKSTLINNLLALGEKVAVEGDTCDPETATIMQYRGTVAGVPVVLYDTPGTDDGTAASDRDLCRGIKRLIRSKKVCLTIFCFSMNEQRFRRSHISTMRAYHEATVNWDSAIVTLTFADKIKAPRRERKSEGFNEAEYFRGKITEWEEKLRDALVQKVGVPPPVAESLIMRPTIDEWDSKLPDNQEWFVPLWLDILDLLAPAACFRFLEIHQDNIKVESDTENSIECDDGRKIRLTDLEIARLKRIAEDKLRSINPRSVVSGVGGAVLVTGGVGAVIAFGVGAAGLTFCGIGAIGILVGGIFIIGAIALAAHVHEKSQSEENKE